MSQIYSAIRRKGMGVADEDIGKLSAAILVAGGRAGRPPEGGTTNFAGADAGAPRWSGAKDVKDFGLTSGGDAVAPRLKMLRELAGAIGSTRRTSTSRPSA